VAVSAQCPFVFRAAIDVVEYYSRKPAFRRAAQILDINNARRLKPIETWGSYMTSQTRIATFSNTGLRPGATLSVIGIIIESGGAPPHSKIQARNASASSRSRVLEYASGLTLFSIVRHRVSMTKVPDAGEDHRHVALVGGGNHFSVAH